MEGRFIPFAAVVAAAALLAACSSGKGDEPTSTPRPPSSTVTLTSPNPTGTPTTGPNMSPGEKPPVMPAAAKQHDPSGALAFAAYYFKAFDWGYATNNPYLVAQISDRNCKACNRYIVGLNEVIQRGQHLSQGRLTIDSSRVVTGHFTVQSDYVIEVFTTEQPVVITDAEGKSSTAAGATSNDASLVFVSWEATAWKVIEVGSPS